MTGFDGDTISPFKAGLSRACPRCGRGRLFAGFLDVAERCDVCGLDLGQQNSSDGPAFFIIMIVGFVVVGLALVVEMSFAPPAWLHMALWLPSYQGPVIKTHRDRVRFSPGRKGAADDAGHRLARIFHEGWCFLNLALAVTLLVAMGRGLAEVDWRARV